MKRRHKLIIILAVVLFCAYSALLIFGSAYITNNKRLPTPADYTEEFLNEFVEISVRSEPYIMKKALFESEDIARKYARILYLENYGGWDYELELWVKHYKKYGVWLAMFRSDVAYLDGPPIIIFKDTDGQVIYYSR